MNPRAAGSAVFERGGGRNPKNEIKATLFDALA